MARLGERASRLGMRAYLVGGAVRDLLLCRENPDIDIAIEGDSLAYLRTWREDGCKVIRYPHFQTGTLIFPDGRRVDVAATRTESYAYPAARPLISPDCLENDLRRRDFTVNAMAWELTEDRPMELIDPFNGRRDIAEKTLRILQEQSFVDDPLRLLRGVRLEARLGFSMDEGTLKAAGRCADERLLLRVTEGRLRRELQLLLDDANAPRMIARLEELRLLEGRLSEFTRCRTQGLG